MTEPISPALQELVAGELASDERVLYLFVGGRWLLSGRCQYERNRTMAWFRKSKNPAEITTADLREQAFTISPHGLGLAQRGGARVWAVLMETGYPDAVASLVTIADGTTSLYFSNGGGIIGAGQHAPVRAAAERFIAVANASVAHMANADSHPLPAIGRVRFYARTHDRLLTAEADETELGDGRHPLSTLFHAGHAVIAALREATPDN